MACLPAARAAVLLAQRPHPTLYTWPPPQPHASQLALVPGAKGMQELLHHIPTWISFRETEKMEVGQQGAGGSAPEPGRECSRPGARSEWAACLRRPGIQRLLAHARRRQRQCALGPRRLRCTPLGPAQWLNRVLEKVWPYYDEAVCKTVKVRNTFELIGD